MTIRTLPLLAAYSTASLTSPWLGPEMPRDLIDATVVVTVESITGSPSTATITPKFQIWHSVLGGNQEESYTGASGTDPTNSWFDIGATANPSMLPDGDWAAGTDVAAAVVATPIAVFKTIRGGFPWRLKLTWALSGGTSPTMRISAIAYCRERFVGGFERTEHAAT